MKIFWTDNFARDTVSERLVADNIGNELEGKIMLKALQSTCTSAGSSWYRSAKDDEQPYKWEP